MLPTALNYKDQIFLRVESMETGEDNRKLIYT